MNAPAPLLSIRDLSVGFETSSGFADAVVGVDLDIAVGETVAIVGESGSGKSTTAMSVLGLLPGTGRVTKGSIRFDGDELVGLPEARMRQLRGGSIGLVPQDPMSNLNPVSKVGVQVAEVLLAHGQATRADVDAKVVEALERAGLNDAERRAKQYPHELSGGMRQRVLIAIGLACRPRLLVADEPTSALDVTLQRVILDQIDAMTAELGTSVLLITHDLGLAAERAQRVAVMHRGRIVETGPAAEILANPQHEYTQRLVAAAPGIAAAPRVRRELAVGDDIVQLRDLTKIYPVRGRKEDFTAAKAVSLDIPRGSTVAIVGESGSGKTTTARMLLQVVEPTSGTISFDGRDLATFDKRELRDFRQRVQPIFQDPYSSLDPSFTVGRIIEEPLKFHRRGSAAERRARVRELLEQVALPAGTATRYPAELSGGQRQRVAIARAIALQPELIVCDEPVSALDVLVQAQILDLLAELQRELGLSYLFISHDLAVVRQISDLVGVMKDGELVEAGPTEQIFASPRHEYTKRLLAAIPGARRSA
ncbi:ABC transporter ATP-binding protein [Arenivirga flava]|uniref:ABC transporter ATP-binding protein n=1 Tax=Arenivirga flava TaxID=1930060 RepID=A0AA37UMM1_9MICO|nr:ABC transporter ATP-binding protein [Arenivirga flava]GMA29636.1 ABC transporter ATP-binding protein [Arenivirga flava]